MNRHADASVMDIMKAEYETFSLWLSEKDMIDRNTAAYDDVQTQIRHMDRAMVRGDVQGFKTAARHARYAYIQAAKKPYRG